MPSLPNVPANAPHSDGPRPRERRRDQGKASSTLRTRILDAAADLFVQHPYDEITIDEIGRKAKVSRRTFYRHFKNKGDALRALSTAHFLSLTDTIDEGMARSADPIVGFVDAYLDWWAINGPVNTRLVERSVDDHELERHRSRAVSQATGSLQVRLRQAGDGECDPLLLHGLAETVERVASAAASFGADLERSRRVLIRLFSSALRTDLDADDS